MDTALAADVDEAFVARANIDHYRKILAHETDDAMRQMLVHLLTDEEDKLKKLARN